jgi:hypothetical protein
LSITLVRYSQRPELWDGTTEGLGEGIDAMTVAAFEAAASGSKPTALCAMTGMKFPESDEYTFPAGLAPVLIDRPLDVGT